MEKLDVEELSRVLIVKLYCGSCSPEVCWFNAFCAYVLEVNTSFSLMSPSPGFEEMLLFFLAIMCWLGVLMASE